MIRPSHLLKTKEFPFQQGDLDSLCSLYAIINLICIKTKNRDLLNAFSLLKTMIEETSKVQLAGDTAASVSQLLLEGVNRDDPNWFLRQLGWHSENTTNLNPETIAKDAKDGAILFFETANNEFSHYTVIRTKNSLADIELFDSYGFKTLEFKNQDWLLDGKTKISIRSYTTLK